MSVAIVFSNTAIAKMFLLLLLYYRHYITQEFVEMLFVFNEPNIRLTIKRLEPIFLKVMSIPQRDILSTEEIQELIIDATENRVERQKKDQKKYYY